MKTKTIYSILLNLVPLFLITGCDNNSAPPCIVNPPDQEISNDIIQDFINAGFEIVTPHDSLPTPKRFLSNWEASKYLAKIKAEQDSIANIWNISRAGTNIRLQYENIGDHRLYYFKYKGVYVEFKGNQNVSSNAYLTEENVHVLFYGTALPITKHEDFSGAYFVYNSKGYTHISITITAKRTVEINGVTLYQNQQIAGIICMIDIPNYLVNIVERDI